MEDSPPPQSQSTGQLGAWAVFLTAVSTILGAVLFLRFGYAVANVGLLGALAIIALGHVVTLPTAMAIAEIATNQRVAGGGAYHIISRSFGIVIGAAVGIALYFSQAISVSFYAIAFAESFRPFLDRFKVFQQGVLSDSRAISIPLMITLFLLMRWKGAQLGVKALYWVVGVLFLSIVLFFFGGTDYDPGTFLEWLTVRRENPDGFFLVFAIVFPAFTGVAAGLGLSGDLRDPKRDIPIGTIAATAVGMIVYILIAWKLAVSASPDELADQFVMSKIAVWGPIIPIGLACATVSSALGSALVAPRTLQALSADRVWGDSRFGDWLRKQADGTGEPLNAAMVTSAIALVFVLMGDVDVVAQIISMFFMVTYGAICLISFFEHFAADPSYRPSFRSRWYVSLVGALACIWCMFNMSALYATLSIVCMFGLYIVIGRLHSERRGLTFMFQGAVFQLGRQLQVFAQKSTVDKASAWRPSVVAISRNSFDRFDEFEFLRWISHRYGFGTYIHHIEGYFSKATRDQASRDLARLVDRAETSASNVYVDTIVCPSATSLVAQLVQLPGISGKANNMLLFGHPRGSDALVGDLIHNYQLIVAAGFDVAVLATSPRGFGYRREIHVWLTTSDDENSALMILLSYILVGHPDWSNATIRMFTVVPADQLAAEESRLTRIIREGRLPISRDNIEVVARDGNSSRRQLVAEYSTDADLVVFGFRGEVLKHQGIDVFQGYEELGNILFINTTQSIDIDRPDEAREDERDESEEPTESVDPNEGQTDVDQASPALPGTALDDAPSPRT